MSREFIKNRIAAVVADLDVAAEELELQATLLRKTIDYNRNDTWGMIMRMHGIKEKTERMKGLSVRLEELRDLWYALPENPPEGP